MAEQYTLPELPYDYSALEPHISARIMELHHDKHHATYVKGANTAVEQLAEARESGNLAAVPKLTRDLAFNLGGHVNHSIFWNNMSPDGGDKPVGELAAAIDDQFGSFDKFREHFTTAATTIQGSGWAVLVYDQLGGNLFIEQLKDSSPISSSVAPRFCSSTCGSTPSTSTTRTSSPTTSRLGGTS